MPLATLRGTHLPSGLSLGQPKAAKLGAVWPTCGDLAAATDAEVRQAISDGLLKSIGLPWLRRLCASLAHLRPVSPQADARGASASAEGDPMVVDAAGGGEETASAAARVPASAVDASAVQAASAMDVSAVVTAVEASDSSDSSESDSESSDSSIGSAIGTDAEVDESDESDSDGEL